MKAYCAKKYGRKKEFVDAEIAARLGMLGEDEAEAVEEELPEVPDTPKSEEPTKKE